MPSRPTPPKRKAATRKATRKAKSKQKRQQAIEVRGARQNNLKGIDVDIPLGEFVVVTGASGSGKSSFAFDTLYAEGQRRYVETFSPYVRQFFERMDKPKVDEIRGIPPAIAIEQSNHVRTTRSTVGTITEINDYLKVLFAQMAKAYCPKTGLEIRPDTPESVRANCLEAFAEETPLVVFGIPCPTDSDPADFLGFLEGQGYLRILLFGQLYRTDAPDQLDRKLPAVVEVVQDRISPKKKTRFLEAVETAFDRGKGRLAVVLPGKKMVRREFSSFWDCPESGVVLQPPAAGLFSFNHPLGACPACKGFGRVIGLDLEKAVPDHSLSIMEGVVKPFQGERGGECQDDLERCAAARGIPLDRPFTDIDEADREWILYGEGGDPEENWQNGQWYGVKGFFDWLERRAYKMHVRVFLSRYRSYTTCHDCRGGRLRPDALCFRLEEKTIAKIWRMPVTELLPFFEAMTPPKGDKSTDLALGEIQSRIRYLERVGLGYLDLDRATRSLSGGEVQRVNLCTCLGARLTNVLFVLDEPSVGLHPRDTGRLIEIMEGLRDRGNTLLVVEHEESVIRSADHLIEIGPGRGEGGGELVFAGPAASMPDSTLTGSYLSGKKFIPVPKTRRAVDPERCLQLRGASQHNLRDVDVEIPLGLFTVVSGVSGSGKSTLVHSVLHRNLLSAKGEAGTEEPGRLRGLEGAEKVGDVIMVDQSPLARTPRSTPVLYLGVFDVIRKLYSETETAQLLGMGPGFFSFNSGDGRCERCMGTGFEKVEMQFLSDVYVTCPECEGSRFQDHVLEVEIRDKNLHQLLQTSVTGAIVWLEQVATDADEVVAEAPLRFTKQGKLRSKQRGNSTTSRVIRNAAATLRTLEEVGLGYLTLGQPLNTLSGGESQRLKLVSHLIEAGKKKNTRRSHLFLLDEPTTGLHFDDVALLLRVFDRLVEEGHTLLVVEHNLEVIKCADHLIDLGPEGGAGGGEIVATGTPEQIARTKKSITGQVLAPLLKPPGKPSKRALKVAEAAPRTSYVVRPDSIDVRGAREHNLKNIDVSIPTDKFVVVTGLSGSGKSTLAFDLVFAEGQRRFLDSISTYARQFVDQLERPDVDLISGLPPTVAIEQRVSRGGGKSTVATVTEVYHFLRLLYAKVGEQHAPGSGEKAVVQSISSIVSTVRAAAKKGTVHLMAPLIRGRKGYHTEVAARAEKKGFDTLYVDGKLTPSTGFEPLSRFQEHFIDVVVSQPDSKTKADELRASVEEALRLGRGTARILDAKNKISVLSAQLSCPVTGESFEPPEPRLFSYNSPHGWCSRCRGYGVVDLYDRFDAQGADSMLSAELDEERKRARRLRKAPDELTTCPECEGGRLNEIARHVFIAGRPIHELAALSVADARAAISRLKFTGRDGLIARDIVAEIGQRLLFMEEVGLGYLQLDRSATTLSGGEAQRIRLASQLGSNLRGVLYVLDEPTIGLHARDNAQLLDTLVALRDKGNSVLVVEHDEDTMERSDHVIDLGPGAGIHGGEVVASGPFSKLRKSKNSITGGMLAKSHSHPWRGERRPIPSVKARKGWIRVTGATANNLRNVDVAIPEARLVVLTGVSGSGKSSFLRGVLEPAARSVVNKTKVTGRAKTWTKITGLNHFQAVYEVDQSPIGKTSRSCPATYVKVFDEIRKLFSGLPESRMRGFAPGRFSFNTAGGRCETCEGNGRIKLEMNFLPTSFVDCNDCHGKRFNPATLEIEYHGKTIADVMDLTVEEAAEFFQTNKKIHRTLALLAETGTGYLKLGQPSPTVSGGEAQRIKLVAELARGVGRSENARLKGRTFNPNLYLIEEPTIGLHMSDVEKLVDVLHRLVDGGHTVVVIEHNLDLAAEADYVIDVGPEAGAAGGEIVAAGTPEEIVKVKRSRTAPFLKKVLG